LLSPAARAAFLLSASGLGASTDAEGRRGHDWAVQKN
jgi:hypothetical protein